MLYGTLNQRNPEYRSKEWETICDLYKGGFQLQAHAHKYIHRGVGEPEMRYRDRLQQTSYVNYLATIVDGYVSALFQREPIVMPPSEDGEATKLDPFWDQFRANADLRGNGFASVLRDAFLSALLKRRALVALDFPATQPAETRVAEDASGASRAYAYTVDVEQLIDWEYSSEVRRVVETGEDGARVEFELGRFEWAIVKTCVSRRASPAESRGSYYEEFKVWRINGQYAAWDLFRTRVYGAQEAPHATDVVARVDGGVTSFDCIPLLELKLPDGLWLGNKLASLALEHFQRRSALVAAENRALFAVPIAYLGPEVKAFKGDQASSVQQSPGRGESLKSQYEAKGFAVFGRDDRVEYLEPEGKAFEVVDRQLNELVDAMYRVSAQMAQGITATTVGLARSGQSKQEDRRSMEVLLGAYSAIVEAFAVDIYDEVAEARKESGIAWTVHGLDGYDQIDRTLLISEAKDLSSLAIPSATFRAAYQTQIALDLLQCSPEEQETIRKEIADYYAKNPEAVAPVTESPESEAEEPEDDSKPDAEA